MKKNKIKELEIRIDFLEVKIKVVFVHDIIKARNQLCKYYPGIPLIESEPVPEALHSSWYGLYPNRHWIFLNEHPMIHTVTHESLHCVDQISNYFNIKDTEFRAYLLDYICKKIIGLKRI